MIFKKRYIKEGKKKWREETKSGKQILKETNTKNSEKRKTPQDLVK